MFPHFHRSVEVLVLKNGYKCNRNVFSSFIQIIMSTWMRRGGDNFKMFLNNRSKLHPGEDAARLVAEYIDYATPIVTGIDERIVFVKKSNSTSGNCKCSQLKRYCSSVLSLCPSALSLFASFIVLIFMADWGFL